MVTQVDATLINGVLKPDVSLPLADLTRVRLTVEPHADHSPEAALAALETLKSRLKVQPLHFGGQRYTRDELHERR